MAVYTGNLVDRLESVLLLLLLIGGCFPVSAQKPPDEQIRYYQSKLAQDPAHWPSYAGLGVAYLLKARATDDVAYYAKAEAALKRSLQLQPNYEALRYLAAVYIGQHRFQEAIAYGLQTVATWSSDTRSYVFLSDAYHAIGDYERAAEVAQKMLAIKADFYTLSHSARNRYVRGDVEGAIREMQQALTLAAQDELSRELTPWVQVQLGRYYFGMGDLRQAEQAYQQALTVSPNDALAIEHLAELRTAQKNFTVAIKLYRKLLKRRSSPEWRAALAEVYARAGRAAQAQRLRRQAEAAYRRAIREGRVDYYRHLAQLYLHYDANLAEALILAQKDLKARQDVYAYDTLAWVYYKNERYEEAVKAIQAALRWGTKEAQLFFHAGMIYHRLGDAARARDYLQRALATNPYFDVADAETARAMMKEVGSP